MIFLGQLRDRFHGSEKLPAPLEILADPDRLQAAFFNQAEFAQTLDGFRADLSQDVRHLSSCRRP